MVNYAKIRKHRKEYTRFRTQANKDIPSECPVCGFSRIEAPCQYPSRIWCGKCQQYHQINKDNKYEWVCVDNCEKCKGYYSDPQREYKRVKGG